MEQKPVNFQYDASQAETFLFFYLLFTCVGSDTYAPHRRDA